MSQVYQKYLIGIFLSPPKILNLLLFLAFFHKYGLPLSKGLHN